MKGSLRLRLMLICVLAALIGWVAAAGIAYLGAVRQVQTLFDAHLSLVGGLLATRTRHELGEADYAALQENMLGGEHPGPVAFQIWSPVGQLAHRTANAPVQPLAPDGAGHADREVDGRRWRVFAKRDPLGKYEVHVGVASNALDHMTRRRVWEDLAPVTVSVPLTLLLLAIGVRFGLAPLVRVAREVSTRGHRRLDPIAVDSVPSEARPLIEALNGLFARLDRAFSREVRFASECAHELQSPLTGVRTQVQLALRTSDEGARRRALEQAVVAVDRGARLVEQLLALARCEPDAAPLPRAPVELTRVVRPVLEELAPLAIAKTIELELAPQEVPAVPGNAEALALMTRNLVDNAIRHCPPGSRVIVRTDARDGHACLSVEDNGPGIPAEDRERVCERFYRAPGAGETGSGLGLSIVRNIADIHGARLSLETPPSGRGLRVQVCLPVVETPLAAPGGPPYST